MSQILIQGLGSPRLLLQGLGSPGSQLTVSASGGLRLGSASGPAVFRRLATTGGMTRGGRATASAQFAIIVSGGTRLGGSARLTGKFAITAGGGVQLGGQALGQAISYLVYANAGGGDPIDYAHPLAMIAAPGWTSPALSAPGHYKFGVRTRDLGTGLVEENLDAAIELVIDGAGRDCTAIPPAPLGLRFVPIAGGKARLEWSCPCQSAMRQPLGFNIYVGIDGPISYSVPYATVPWLPSRFDFFRAELGGLAGRGRCLVGVRAYNASGEELNTAAVAFTIDDAPPSQVDSLESVTADGEL